MGILKGLVIGAVGDIRNSSDESISNDQLRKWILANDGRWTSKVDSGTTHLISSKDAFKKNAEPVKQAKKHNVLVVKYDWLEDSLHRRRKLVERKYLWEVERAQRRTRKTIKRLGPQADKKKFDTGCDLAMQDLDSDLYHIFMDSTGFEYKPILLRSNPYLNNFARYDLRLYESHTLPHVYCTVVRYLPPAGQNIAAAGSPSTPASASEDRPQPIRSTSPPLPLPQGVLTNQTQHPEAARLLALITPPAPTPTTKYKQAIAPPNSDFSTAFRAFRHAFRDLTLLSWHERLDAQTQKLRAQAFQLEPFVWRRPAEGLSTGIVAPPGTTIDEGYICNAWGLPGLEERLGRKGGIGSALIREAEEVRAREEARIKREEEEEKGREKGRGVRKKEGYRGQLFNGVNGPVRRGGYESQGQGNVQVGRARSNTPLFNTLGAGGRTGGTCSPTPSMTRTPGRGEAVFFDYRTAKQKRMRGNYDY
ncbi:hypothetical protein BU23DRAFT_336052 [Bimuria novae-zelandiae CBS 107.79]|uniref:BRCT domain-containing protein n=1 Tax=Bimuria novae-zelandiae CBS 107.79 TaxID=1447943 RepID=A0A6A5UMN8_9PLEO|nr:hypothetical protein BU23DRAFT_336052 [Bimuria novae-zelandiae CBS 107.79]